MYCPVSHYCPVGFGCLSCLCLLLARGRFCRCLLFLTPVSVRLFVMFPLKACMGTSGLRSVIAEITCCCDRGTDMFSVYCVILF